MQVALRGTDTPHQYLEVPMSRARGNTAPQISALEPECWGVVWGVCLPECPQALDVKSNTGRIGTGEMNRTRDRLITHQLLYPLSCASEA